VPSRGGPSHLALGDGFATHTNHLAWPKPGEQFANANARHEGTKILDVVGARLEHDDRNRIPGNVSLELKTLIDGDEHVELSLGRAKETPVLEATPSPLAERYELLDRRTRD
jgi:hypothetical protein